MSKDKFPFFHFDVGAWWKDNEVQTLDHFHKGVWFELLLIMFESPERGVLLQQNGQQMPNRKAAARLRLLDIDFEKALAELLDSGVARKRDDGAIFCERMVRDEMQRINKSLAGKASAQAKKEKLLLQQNGQQTVNRQHNRTSTLTNTDTYTDTEHDPDFVLKKNSALQSQPIQPVDPADAALFEFAESQLVPSDDPKIQTSNHFISAGRRPMKKYPEIWLTPMELVDAAKAIAEAGIPKNRLDLVMKPVAARIRGYIAEGRDPARTPAYTHLTTFGLEAALKVLKASSDLERSKTFLANTGVK